MGRGPTTTYRRINEAQEAITMINIAMSSRSLAAARRVDPQVSPAAVHAAVEAAIAEQLRQLGRATNGDGMVRGRAS